MFANLVPFLQRQGDIYTTLNRQQLYLEKKKLYHILESVIFFPWKQYWEFVGPLIDIQSFFFMLQVY